MLGSCAEGSSTAIPRDNRKASGALANQMGRQAGVDTFTVGSNESVLMRGKAKGVTGDVEQGEHADPSRGGDRGAEGSVPDGDRGRSSKGHGLEGRPISGETVEAEAGSKGGINDHIGGEEDQADSVALERRDSVGLTVGEDEGGGVDTVAVPPYFLAVVDEMDIS